MILWRRATPIQITLPKEETFVAIYEKTSRQNLPKNVTVRQIRQGRLRKHQKRRQQLHKNVTNKTRTKKWKFFK